MAASWPCGAPPLAIYISSSKLTALTEERKETNDVKASSQQEWKQARVTAFNYTLQGLPSMTRPRQAPPSQCWRWAPRGAASGSGATPCALSSTRLSPRLTRHHSSWHANPPNIHPYPCHTLQRPHDCRQQCTLFACRLHKWSPPLDGHQLGPRERPRGVAPSLTGSRTPQIGWLDGHASPVTQVAWAPAGGTSVGGGSSPSHLLLATGAADGGVRLFSQSAARRSSDGAGPAASEAPGLGRGQCMERLGAVLQPDLRPVTCLAFSQLASPANEAGAAPPPPPARTALPRAALRSGIRFTTQGSLSPVVDHVCWVD